MREPSLDPVPHSDPNRDDETAATEWNEFLRVHERAEDLVRELDQLGRLMAQHISAATRAPVLPPGVSPETTSDRHQRSFSPTGQIKSTSFSVPSPDLVREWVSAQADMPDFPDSVILQATQEFQQDLVATIADFALSAQDRGVSGPLALSRLGRFDEGFVRQLMRNLPIDPYQAPQILAGLHEELLASARAHELEASWGGLFEDAGDLRLVLTPKPAARRALALAR